jgi:hypothetical protein
MSGLSVPIGLKPAFRQSWKPEQDGDGGSGEDGDLMAI